VTSGLPWGLALSSGVNTYLPLFLLALFARFSHLVHVSSRFEWLISDQAILILGLLAASEIMAQKFPVVDNFWDLLHTLLRPIAGALVAGATLSTDNVFEIILAMLIGGSLAAAAHSTKSSLRLMSTSKSFGAANLALSLGEDAAVLVGTLLSVYAPWVMFGIVILFGLIFALIGPRIVRGLWFDLNIVSAWFGWMVRRLFRISLPSQLKESLLDVPVNRLRELSARLEVGEEFHGVVTGWKRSGRGPRRTWLLITSRRLLWITPRMLRTPKVQSIACCDVALARHRNLIIFSKLEVLTRGNEIVPLSLTKRQAPFGEMAAGTIASLSRHDESYDLVPI
jgi:hypothetical protein